MTRELGERIVRIRYLKILSVIRGIGERHGNFHTRYHTLSVIDPNSFLCLFVESCSMSEHQVVIICPHCPALPAHSSGNYHGRKVLEDTRVWVIWVNPVIHNVKELSEIWTVVSLIFNEFSWRHLFHIKCKCLQFIEAYLLFALAVLVYTPPALPVSQSAGSVLSHDGHTGPVLCLET